VAGNFLYEQFVVGKIILKRILMRAKIFVG